jgi:hypothetical protein
MLRNQAIALLRHERIETMLPKAKELRPFVERLITLAKRGVAANDAKGTRVSGPRRPTAASPKRRSRPRASASGCARWRVRSPWYV